MVHAIDEHGREIIDMNTNVSRLLEIAQMISKIGIGVTIRHAYDTFREQVVVVIIEWLLDLTHSRLGTDTLIIREVIATELLSPRHRESNIYGPASHLNDLSDEISNPCRIDWMFLYHARLWKQPRISLKEIYASVLMLSHPHKLAMGSIFSNQLLYSLQLKSVLREPLCGCLFTHRGCISSCGQRGRNVYQVFCSPALYRSICRESHRMLPRSSHTPTQQHHQLLHKPNHRKTYPQCSWRHT